MSRLSLIDPENATGKTRELLDETQSKIGRVPNLLRAFANSPAVLETYLGFSKALSSTTLSQKQREQIALYVSQMNDCHYCLSAHSAIGKMAGLSEEEILDSRQGRAIDRKTETAVQFAGAIVKRNGKVTDDDLRIVREGGLNDGEIVEVVAITIFTILTNYVQHAAETEIDFPVVPPTIAA